MVIINAFCLEISLIKGANYHILLLLRISAGENQPSCCIYKSLYKSRNKVRSRNHSCFRFNLFFLVIYVGDIRRRAITAVLLAT